MNDPFTPEKVLALLKIGLEKDSLPVRRESQEEVMIEVERDGKTLEAFCEVLRNAPEPDRRWAGELWDGPMGRIDIGFTCDKSGREIELTGDELNRAVEEYRENGPTVV